MSIREIVEKILFTEPATVLAGDVTDREPDVPVADLVSLVSLNDDKETDN